MRHRSGLRPDIVAFALYRHRAHCVSLVAMVNLPKVVNIGDDLGSSPDYPFVKARTQGMLAVSTGMTMSGSWGTLFSELKSYVYIIIHTHKSTYRNVVYTHIYIYNIHTYVKNWLKSQGKGFSGNVRRFSNVKRQLSPVHLSLVQR